MNSISFVRNKYNSDFAVLSRCLLSCGHYPAKSLERFIKDEWFDEGRMLLSSIKPANRLPHRILSIVCLKVEQLSLLHAKSHILNLRRTTALQQHIRLDAKRRFQRNLLFCILLYIYANLRHLWLI